MKVTTCPDAAQMPCTVNIRIGVPADAETIAALAIQVFLDTYATAGVRLDLAREAFAEYSHDAFSERFRENYRVFHLAESSCGLLGFAELLRSYRLSPIDGVGGSELVRLYVQPQAQRCGIGRMLIERAERTAASFRSRTLWLSAWEQNTRALSFYKHMGYVDVGQAHYMIQGQAFANRILHKPIRMSARTSG